MAQLAAQRPDRSLYQAVWRWHFIAGLLVMPFLVMMAITGGLYLFKDEITHLVYRKMIDVPARATELAPLSAVIANAEAGLRGHVLQISPQDRPDRAVRMIVRAPSGDALTAYADPYDGRLLGAFPYGGVMQTIRKIHSLQKFGFWASCLIEIAAGWAIVLVGTGVYMWWPRGRKGGVISVRGTPRSGDRRGGRPCDRIPGDDRLILVFGLGGQCASLGRPAPSLRAARAGLHAG
jgi:uncharacterized iron-regulated membrane protein